MGHLPATSAGIRLADGAVVNLNLSLQVTAPSGSPAWIRWMRSSQQHVPFKLHAQAAPPAMVTSVRVLFLGARATFHVKTDRPTPKRGSA